MLDEIDQIETSIKSTTDLYKIFEWPFLKSSKLILIGRFIGLEALLFLLFNTFSYSKVLPIHWISRTASCHVLN